MKLQRSLLLLFWAGLWLLACRCALVKPHFEQPYLRDAGTPLVGASLYDDMIHSYTTAFNSKDFDKIWDQTTASFQQQHAYDSTIKLLNDTLNNFGPILTFQRVSEMKVNQVVVEGYYNYTTEMEYSLAHFTGLIIIQYKFVIDPVNKKFDDFYIIDLGTQSISVLNQFAKSSEKAFVLQLNEEESACDYRCMLPYSVSINYLYPIIFEFARQAGNQMIDPNQMIDLAAVNRYFSTYLDSTNYQLWLNSQKIVDNKVSLYGIAEGVSKYQVFACIEFLQDLLGIQNIDQMAQSLDISIQDNYYQLSAIFALRNQQGLPYIQYLEWLLQLNTDSYMNLVAETHQQIQQDPSFLNNTDWLKDTKVVDIYLNFTNKGKTGKYKRIAHQISQGVHFPLNQQLMVERLLSIDHEYFRNTLKNFGMGFDSRNWMKKQQVSLSAYAQDQMDTYYAMALDFTGPTSNIQQDNLRVFVKLMIENEPYRTAFCNKLQSI